MSNTLPSDPITFAGVMEVMGFSGKEYGRQATYQRMRTKQFMAECPVRGCISGRDVYSQKDVVRYRDTHMMKEG